MGQRGVHATINKDENTGRFVVHLTTVQWSLHIAEIIKFALQHAGKDGYSQTEFLNCLEKTVRNMSHISAFDLMDEDYKFYNRSRPMEGGYSTAFEIWPSQISMIVFAAKRSSLHGTNSLGLSEKLSASNRHESRSMRFLIDAMK